MDGRVLTKRVIETTAEERKQITESLNGKPHRQRDTHPRTAGERTPIRPKVKQPRKTCLKDVCLLRRDPLRKPGSVEPPNPSYRQRGGR